MTMLPTSADPGENAGHPNNFNLLRLLAATLVIFSHSYMLRSPAGTLKETYLLNSAGVGWAAVNIFFVMSGYLIARSLKRTSGIRRFAINRILRIYPGLFICVVVTTLTLGLVYRRADFFDYITSHQTILFMLGNISALSVKFYLPGVFEHNIYVGAVDGSLWSLPFEISCYVIIAFAAFSGMLTNVSRRLIIFSFFALFYVIGGFLIETGRFPHSVSLGFMHRLTICFSLGALYANISPRLHIRWWHLCIAAVAFSLSCLSPILFFRCSVATLSLSLFVFWAAFLQHPFLQRLRDLPDWSYGLYIYAFPIQQLLLAFWPGLSLNEHFCVALLATSVPASLSWHFIEKPALRLKNSRTLKVWARQGALPLDPAGAGRPQTP